MRKGANFLRWILTVFMVISAIVFFPSVSSVLCLLFAVLAAPVKSLQRFWKYQVKLRGGGKALLMTALVIGAALTAPLEPAPQAPAEDDRQQEIQETVQETVPEEPDASSQGQTVSQNASSETVPEEPQAPAEQAPVPPAEEAPQPSAETPPDVPEAPSEEPAQSLPEPETPAVSAPQGRTIYVTATGKRYHYDNNCGRGTYYPATMEEALARGLTPCEKCAGG